MGVILTNYVRPGMILQVGGPPPRTMLKPHAARPPDLKLAAAWRKKTSGTTSKVARCSGRRVGMAFFRGPGWGKLPDLFASSRFDTMSMISICHARKQFEKLKICPKSWKETFFSEFLFSLRIMGSQVTGGLEIPDPCYAHPNPSIGGSNDS